ncbi:MAG: hypothetical protein UX89_C0028G0005 [Parcubacteria group bacterium GW2011_GWA2_47_16]|nr:MAG: hypothetical protein UX89_C0028G0005 [Parcubacteria group bacterium GW2011_GWA2_47_16]
MKKLLKENIGKHACVIVLTLLAYPFINNAVKTVDDSSVANFLIIISILLVSVCFANFAFTYKDTATEEKAVRALSHSTTGLFLFLTATLLLTMCIGVAVTYPPLGNLIYTFSFLLYAGFVLYDFWDLLRKR